MSEESLFKQTDIGRIPKQWSIKMFEELFEIPLRNGLTRPKRVRGTGIKMINMGELFAYDRLSSNITMDKVPVSSEEIQKFSAKKDDLLFARQSLVVEGAGKCSIIINDKNQMTFESHLIRVRLNQKIANPMFYFYFFKSSLGRNIISSIIEQVAAAGIRGRDLSKLPVIYPNLKEQDAIAEILTTIDDKIQLNRQMNTTLEQMAQAIFKYWFIDFEFPDENGQPYRSSGGEMVDSELGEIPAGWEVKSFADTIEVIGGGTPKTSVTEYWNGDIPWFSVVDAPNPFDVWVLDTEKKITQLGVEKSSTRILPIGTTIISARGTVGRVALVGVPMAMNQSCYGFRGKNENEGFFTYFSTLALVLDFRQKSHGSVFSTITKDTLKGVTVVLPPSHIIQSFEQRVAPILWRIRENVFESRTIAELRNTLLPQLISGQLRVKDAEKTMEQSI
ncbi:MAG: restriction endonuclease subunit S [Promethearchaeota archaeon]